MKKEIQIFVYGSCHFSELLEGDVSVGPGGYGVVITTEGKVVDQFSGGFSRTTNARMDIMGVIEGLNRIKEPSNIVVFLSNGYVVDTLTKGWLEKWEKKGFKKKKHADLWRRLNKILQDSFHDVAFELSRNVRLSSEFQLAEQLGKVVAGKKNLPVDLKPESNGLFEPKESAVDLEIEEDKPILESICVDASSIGNPGVTEYRGVDTKNGEVLFQHKYGEATNNIGEFLAIVHALALYKKNGKDLSIIYSDSATAISWVKQKKCKTKYKRSADNSSLFDDLQRAVTWLEGNVYDTRVLKWKTSVWGQIPADYGRK